MVGAGGEVGAAGQVEWIGNTDDGALDIVAQVELELAVDFAGHVVPRYLRVRANEAST